MRPSILVVLLPCLACSERPTALDAGAQPAIQDATGAAADAGRFVSEIVLEAGTKLGGCATGDFDPSLPGDEIAAVAGDGSIHLLRRTPDGWEHEVVARASGELIQCAAGDADADSPGDELLVFGMEAGREDDGGRGAAHLVRFAGPRAGLETVLLDEALLHGGCIAEVDPDTAGAELVLAGFSRRVHVLSADGVAGWSAQVAGSLPGDAKNAVAVSDGAAIACNDGSLMHLRRAHGEWELLRIELAPAGLARLGGDGERLVVARDDGALALVTDGEGRVIHRESSKLRGAVLAELDPTAEGLEAATAGYGRTITVLRRAGDAWKATVVFEDTDRFHHLAAGELDPQSPGAELVACGYSGRLVVLAWRGPR